MTTGYRTLVDWDQDASLEGDLVARGLGASALEAREDVSARVRVSPSITISRGRDQIRALAPPMAGRFDCELDNQSKDYSPEYSSGPLYGYLIPGITVRQTAFNGSTLYYLFTGPLDDLPQHPEQDKRSVSLPALGMLSKLRGKKVSTALYQSITVDTALGHLFDAAGYPSGADYRSFDTGKTTLDWWWLDEEDAFIAMVAILNTEGPGAAIYEDGFGRAVFKNRHHRLVDARCTASQATFSDTGGEPKHSAPFSYQPRLKDIINLCTIEVKTRAAAGSYTEVWALGETVTLSPGEVWSKLAKGSDIFTDAQTPASGDSDYTVSAGSLSSVTLDRTSGASCTITLTAGSSGATVTGLRLRAKLVAVTNTTPVSNTIDTSTSKTRHGDKPYPLSMRAEIAVNTAQDLANAVVGWYQNPRPTVEITVNNGHADRITAMLPRDISDRITINEAQSGLVSMDAFVEQISDEIVACGKLHLRRLGCEKAVGAMYAVWGSAIWGTSVWGF